MIVVDTNIVVYLLMPGAHTEWAEAVLMRDAAWAVPTLWRSEFRNVLSRYMRERRLTLEHALQLQASAEALVAGREYVADSSQVLEATAHSECTAYDCEFIVTARQLRVPLVTHDKQLLSAFPDVATTAEKFCSL